PKLTAVVDGDLRYTWPQLDRRVNQLANAFRKAGVVQGERVMWVGQNSFRLLEGLLAAAKIGAVFCPANWRLGPQELAFVLDDFAPKVVIWQDAEIGSLVRAARELSSTAALWVQHDADGEHDYESWIGGVSDEDDEARID